MRTSKALSLGLPLAAALLGACGEPPPAVTPVTQPSAPAPIASAPLAASSDAAPAAPKLDAVPRLAFNRIAAELALPLFWVDDANKSGAIDPTEVATLWGIGPLASPWVEGGSFTPAFLKAYEAIAHVYASGASSSSGLSDAEKKRRALVLTELGQGRPTIVRSDFRTASAEDRAVVDHVLKAADAIEQIYAKQRGASGLAAGIPEGDTASRALFFRNQGPWCAAPLTEKDPACSALPTPADHVSGLYPASLQKDPAFCAALEKRKDQKALLDPFTVVVEAGGDLKALPYNVAFKSEMGAISRELKAAADAVTSPGEAPFKAYLTAASQSFLDNDWVPADEAWAKMNVNNSKWYLRIAPDEVYSEPCNHKAGFHVSFARINQDSVAWQKKLDPVKTDMEGALAKLAGPPYKAKNVKFHLPDFIDIVLNAGDSRPPHGATIGQSLPNFGKVANESRGRTVAMTNLYTDKDSEAAFNEQVGSVMCKASTIAFNPSLSTMSTVLHEASHNLGPSHDYKVKGKNDREIFGGTFASTLEELKAQTGAMYFADWLADRGLLDKKTALAAHARDTAWAFGHIAQGMYTSDNKPKAYSQLAAVQMGYLVSHGAIAWKGEEMAANGKDKGCFELALDKYPANIESLGKVVLGIKGRGDKVAAKKLFDEYVDDSGEWKRLRGVIQERWLRSPKASFVYSVER